MSIAEGVGTARMVVSSTGKVLMDLSIIIVNWNTRDMLRDCLRSVFGEVWKLKAEVFVVDNGSTDGSADMVMAEFPEVRLIANDVNLGFAAANNQALRVAEGRYLLLLNSDTLVHGDVLLRSKEFLDTDDRVGAMGCRVLNADGSIQPSCGRFPSLLNLLILTSGLWKLGLPGFLDRYQLRNWAHDEVRDVDTLSGCYIMLRREAVEEIGLLDESFYFFGEETDWCRRLRDRRWRVVFAPVGNITHFGGGSSGALRYRRDVMLSSGTVRLHLKYGGRLKASAAWLILLIFNLSRACYWIACSALSSGKVGRERARHFRAVVRSFASAWPQAQGGRS
jgi:GT2 family glycosyltransferase